jgi:hypothetical protein
MSFIRLAAAAFALAALGAAPLTAFAQTPAPVTQTATSTHTAQIVAIDYTSRIVSLKFDDGTTQTVGVSPAVTRFPSLKVGDTVTFTSTDTVVYSIAKPGSAMAPESDAMAAAPGAKPGGTASKTLTTVVTVTAIDPSVPSVTVKTADGRITSMKVKDAKNLTGLKVGDQVQVTYTQSLMISIK